MKTKLQLLKEESLASLYNTSVSNLTQKHLLIRYQNDHGYSVENAMVNLKSNPRVLDLTFKIRSTFNDGESVDKGIPSAGKGSYIVLIRVLDLNNIFDNFKDYQNKLVNDRIKLLDDIMKTCDVLLYSNDPSFMFQGVWEDLEKIGMSLFPFPGPKGKNIWHDRHNQSGGLNNSDKRITKHIAQLSANYDIFLKDIDAKLMQPYAINEKFDLRLNKNLKYISEVTVKRLIKDFMDMELNSKQASDLLNSLKTGDNEEKINKSLNIFNIEQSEKQLVELLKTKLSEKHVKVFEPLFEQVVSVISSEPNPKMVYDEIFNLYDKKDRKYEELILKTDLTKKSINVSFLSGNAINDLNNIYKTEKQTICSKGVVLILLLSPSITITGDNRKLVYGKNVLDVKGKGGRLNSFDMQSVALTPEAIYNTFNSSMKKVEKDYGLTFDSIDLSFLVDKLCSKDTLTQKSYEEELNNIKGSSKANDMKLDIAFGGMNFGPMMANKNNFKGNPKKEFVLDFGVRSMPNFTKVYYFFNIVDSNKSDELFKAFLYDFILQVERNRFTYMYDNSSLKNVITNLIERCSNEILNSVKNFGKYDKAVGYLVTIDFILYGNYSTKITDMDYSSRKLDYIILTNILNGELNTLCIPVEMMTNEMDSSKLEKTSDLVADKTIKVSKPTNYSRTSSYGVSI